MRITRDEIQAHMRECSLFKEFSDEELGQFLELLDPIEVSPGHVIVKQDDPGDSMFLLVHGTAKVIHHRQDQEVSLAVLTDGDFFGELALVDKGPRSADVIAEDDCVLLGVTQAAIGALAGVYPSAAFKFLITLGRILVDRLRKSNQRYIDSMLFPLHGPDNTDE